MNPSELQASSLPIPEAQDGVFESLDSAFVKMFAAAEKRGEGMIIFRIQIVPLTQHDALNILDVLRHHAVYFDTEEKQNFLDRLADAFRFPHSVRHKHVFKTPAEIHRNTREAKPDAEITIGIQSPDLDIPGISLEIRRPSDEMTLALLDANNTMLVKRAATMQKDLFLTQAVSAIAQNMANALI
jgi:hypothetical protein